MNKQAVINTLDALGRAAETQVDSLNCGGCAVYASMVGRELEKLGIPVRGIVAMEAWEIPNLDKVRKHVEDTGNISHWNANGVEFNHVGLQFKLGNRWYQYDSSGVTGPKPWLKHEYWEVCKGSLSMVELENLANSPTGWNEWFNRHTEIPKLKKLTKQFFKEVVP